MRKSVVLLFAVIAATGLVWSDMEVNETRPADRNAEINIENIAGSIVVTGWDREEIEVTGTLGKNIEGVDIDGDRDSWVIEVDYPNNKNSGGADLVIRVPRGCTLEVETVSADIDVSEVEGDAELESVSGRINYVGGADVLELNTVSGAIEAITDRPVQDGDFESVSGRITLESDLASGGRFDLETVSGNIELRLPASVSADFDIESFSGSISNDFGVKPERPSRYLPSEELSFSLGGGDARVTAKTISGTIRLVEM
jgi:DUF4097 and DUF4098 domain-containing protein YvlB